MTRDELCTINQAAVRQLKPMIDADFPPKQFVAIAGGRIVADDADFDRLLAKLAALGVDVTASLIERAGDALPEFVTII